MSFSATAPSPHLFLPTVLVLPDSGIAFYFVVLLHATQTLVNSLSIEHTSDYLCLNVPFLSAAFLNDSLLLLKILRGSHSL